MQAYEQYIQYLMLATKIMPIVLGSILTVMFVLKMKAKKKMQKPRFEQHRMKITPQCEQCNLSMKYTGVRDFHEGGSFLAGHRKDKFQMYFCAHCGQVKWFKVASSS
jgi:hypothetical protein